MTSIALIDYGAGNLRSVAKALGEVGAQVTITDQPAELSRADKIVLPGVGSFGDGMRALMARGLVDPIKAEAAAGKPLLGICLGMQLLLQESEEMGRHKGLALLPGRVCRFPENELKVPHTGWNQLWLTLDSPLLRDVSSGSYAYFNHSYYCEPADQVVAARTDYGLRFASALWHQNLFGLQFHPEKSQEIGLSMLKEFVQGSDV